MAWGPSQGYYRRFGGVSKIFPGGPWEIMTIKAAMPAREEAQWLQGTLRVPYTNQKIILTKTMYKVYFVIK